MTRHSIFRSIHAFVARTAACALICLSLLASAHAVNRDIAFGAYHAVALRDDGRVLTWGLNASGQLGRGDVSVYSDAEPQLVEGLSNVTQVAASTYYSMVLTSNGAVWIWGGPAGMQVEDPYVPAAVSGLPPIAQVAAGGAFQLFLTSGGDLYCLGSYACGGKQAVTSPVLMLHNVQRIAAGALHVMAVTQNGALYVWGSNEHGQVGIGSKGLNNNVFAPALVMNGVAAIAAGGWSSYAMKTDGSVWAWGYNGEGRDPQTSALGSLCTGDNIDHLVPFPVAPLPTGAAIASITAGGYNVFFKGSDAKFYACGDNRAGKLGVGIDRDVLPFTATAMAVPGAALQGVQAVLRVGMNNVAIASDGCQFELNGYNGFDLIDPQSTQDFFNAFAVGTMPWSCAKRAVISAADRTAFFLGRTKTWGVGSNTEGELGTGSSTAHPVQLAESQPLELAAGHVHTLALHQDGTVWGWGDNQLGQLGFEPSLCSRRCPRAQMPGISGVIQIAAAWDFSLMLKADGTVWIAGELPPSGTNLHAPTRIAGIDNVTQIVAGGVGATGGEAAIFMKTQTGWYGMGAGRLLGGSAASQPVLLPQLVDFTTIRVSNTIASHACGQKSDRTLWCWGRNFVGQLGDGTMADSMVPVAVLTQDLSTGGPVTDYAVGASNTAILTTDGRVWMTGGNSMAQMGNGGIDYFEHSTPEVVSGVSAVNGSVHMEHHGVYVARADCFPVRAWGYNETGNLGLGTWAFYQLRPAYVVNTAGTGYLDLCQ